MLNEAAALLVAPLAMSDGLMSADEFAALCRRRKNTK
jgi:hypothetical protein